MAEEAPVTTDVAGVNRTGTGEITTEPATPATTPTAETPPKPAEPPKADGEKSLLNADGKPPAPTGAPEKYGEYKVAEGFVLDPEIKIEADKLFKSMNLSQDQAQELVNFHVAKTKEAFDAPFNAFQEQRKEWREAAESNPELRGKLSPGGEVLTTIARALDGLGDPKLASDFREAMDHTGAGDNPAFILTFYRMAQRLTEGSHVTGRGPAVSGQQRPGQAARSVAQELWPNLPSTANRG